MAAQIILIATGSALALATGQLWAVAVPVAAIVGFYVGLDSGEGTGDAWWLAMLLVAAIGGAVASAAAVIGRRLRG